MIMPFTWQSACTAFKTLGRKFLFIILWTWRNTGFFFFFFIKALHFINDILSHTDFCIRYQEDYQKQNQESTNFFFHYPFNKYYWKDDFKMNNRTKSKLVIKYYIEIIINSENRNMKIYIKTKILCVKISYGK